MPGGYWYDLSAGTIAGKFYKRATKAAHYSRKGASMADEAFQIVLVDDTSSDVSLTSS